MLLILAAHEHYSIDVFIAFFLTSRLFLYYHSLANNAVLHSRSDHRLSIWFPMFSYFEKNVPCMIPNVLRVPWPISLMYSIDESHKRQTASASTCNSDSSAGNHHHKRTWCIYNSCAQYYLYPLKWPSSAVDDRRRCFRCFWVFSHFFCFGEPALYFLIPAVG